MAAHLILIAGRITASLLLWYVLSAVSERGRPPRAWDLSLIPHSSSLLVSAIIIPSMKFCQEGVQNC
ncbi:hypothetical protein NQZ68_001523 [Dissostichus eleginoides]|nr:hypothetical protein NQZ68_001523 [Dissostichus eleginoides]